MQHEIQRRHAAIRSPRRGGFYLCLFTALVTPMAVASDSAGVDPSMALWGSSAVALLFTVGGSLALAQYHRAAGAIDGRLIELRNSMDEHRKLLALTREDYARRHDLARFESSETTLRAEARAQDQALRAEMRTQDAQHRAEMAELREEVRELRGDVGKVLTILTTPGGGAR